MNIFYLDRDPLVCAQMHCDKHVVKMIVETAQLLSTAAREYGCTAESLYKSTHKNHPSAVWARQAVENYNWLVDHLFALGTEYTYRYGKQHATITKLGVPIASPPLNLKEWDMTPMPSCMDEQYKIGEDPIVNYRNYYKYGKTSMHSWKKRETPEWI
jgi:hypothetical protein